MTPRTQASAGTCSKARSLTGATCFGSLASPWRVPTGVTIKARCHGSATLRLRVLRRRGPRPCISIPRLERRDPVAIAFRERDVVPALEQALAAHRIDGEGVAAIAADDGLLLEIDGDGKFWRAGERGHELGGIGVGDDGGEEPVLHGVAGEDVAERGRDHAADAVVVERVDRRFARRAA